MGHPQNQYRAVTSHSGIMPLGKPELQPGRYGDPERVGHPPGKVCRSGRRYCLAHIGASRVPCGRGGRPCHRRFRRALRRPHTS